MNYTTDITKLKCKNVEIQCEVVIGKIVYTPIKMEDCLLGDAITNLLINLDQEDEEAVIIQTIYDKTRFTRSSICVTPPYTSYSLRLLAYFTFTVGWCDKVKFGTRSGGATKLRHHQSNCFDLLLRPLSSFKQ